MQQSFKKLILLVLILVPFGIIEALTLSGNIQFKGDLAIGGALSKGSGSFLIDHPLKPKTHLLFHSFVESPDVKNIYDGIVTLDENGTAEIELPGYFEELNKDFRYQFFPHNKPMPNLHIAKEVNENRFTIGGGAPNGVVSWQVTGIRHDPFILRYPIEAEVEKGPDSLIEKGEYLFEGYKTQ